MSPDASPFEFFLHEFKRFGLHFIVTSPFLVYKLYVHVLIIILSLFERAAISRTKRADIADGEVTQIKRFKKAMEIAQNNLCKCAFSWLLVFIFNEFRRLLTTNNKTLFLFH